jgi:hypothetical protein
LRARGASETVLIEEVDEVAALGALGDFCLMRQSQKLHVYIHIYTCINIYDERKSQGSPCLSIGDEIGCEMCACTEGSRCGQVTIETGPECRCSRFYT